MRALAPTFPTGRTPCPCRLPTAWATQSAVFTLSFTLSSTRPLPPTNVHLITGDLTGTSNTETKARNLTVELSSAAGTLVTLYMNGTQISQAPAAGSPLDFEVPGTLPDGKYFFTATAASASGLVESFLHALHGHRRQRDSCHPVLRAGRGL